MDKIDSEILKELTKDSQKSFSRVAKKIGISPKTLQRRYEKMKKEGLILRSSITLDLSKIGYQGKAYLMITNAPNQDKTMTVDALSQMQNVFLFTEIVGDIDMLAIAAVNDYKSIIDLVNALRKLPSVDKVEVDFSTDTAFPVGKEFNELFQTEIEETDA
jgi:Lrp/AsnC family transcriptional regulator for asnA, asnC and gidA